MSGMLMSVMIRSKRWRGSSFSASKPLWVVMAWTSGMDSTVDAMKSREAFQSSTIRILNPVRSRPFAWVKALQESSRSYQIPAQSLRGRRNVRLQCWWMFAPGRCSLPLEDLPQALLAEHRHPRAAEGREEGALEGLGA